MSLLIVNTIQPQSGSIVNISGSLQISQSLIVADDITLSGKLTLGNANTDSIVVNSEFTSSLIPDIDGAFDLGTGVKKWGTLFAKSGSFDNISGSLNLTDGLVTITSASISYLSGSSPITVAGEMIPDITNTHNLGSVTKNFNDLFINDISASGDITSSGTGSFDGGIDSMDATGSFGYISASGDISTSGNIFGNAITATSLTGTLLTVAQPNIISLGTIFNLAATNITSSGNVTASSFQTNNISIGVNGLGQISASRVSASAGFEADTASTSSFGYISSSGMIYTETSISASGIINSEGDISSSANIGAIGNAYNGFMPGTGSFGNVTASHTIHVGSAVPLGHGITLTHTGHISASRVSASAGFEADTLSTSSFGYISSSGTIYTEANISASSTLAGTALTLTTAGVHKATIDASGNIAAEGIISSSGVVSATALTLTTAGVHKATIDASGNIAAEGAISSSALVSSTSLNIKSAGVHKASIDASGNTDIEGTLNVAGIPTFQSAPLFTGVQRLSTDAILTIAETTSLVIFAHAASSTSRVITMPAALVGRHVKIIWEVEQSAGDRVLTKAGSDDFVGAIFTSVEGNSAGDGDVVSVTDGTVAITLVDDINIGSEINCYCGVAGQWIINGQLIIDSVSSIPTIA